jgi:RecA/RadA recombinase
LCYNIASNFLRLGWVLYVDIERSWDPEWAKKFVDPDALFVMRPGPGGGEAQVDAIKDLLMSDNPPALVVLDSLTALTSSKAQDRDLDKALMGVDAAFNNRLVRILNVVNNDTAIVIVGQYREGLGTWDYIPGGHGIQHLASVILEMKSSPLRAADSDLAPDVEDRQQIGILSRWFVSKNKLGRPYDSGYELIYRDGFIDVFDSQLRIALQKGIVVQAGSWYSLPNGDKVQGKSKIRDWVAENGPLEKS